MLFLLEDSSLVFLWMSELFGAGREGRTSDNNNRKGEHQIIMIITTTTTIISNIY